MAPREKTYYKNLNHVLIEIKAPGRESCRFSQKQGSEGDLGNRDDDRVNVRTQETSGALYSARISSDPMSTLSENTNASDVVGSLNQCPSSAEAERQVGIEEGRGCADKNQVEKNSNIFLNSIFHKLRIFFNPDASLENQNVLKIVENLLLKYESTDVVRVSDVSHDPDKADIDRKRICKLLQDWQQRYEREGLPHEDRNIIRNLPEEYIRDIFDFIRNGIEERVLTQEQADKFFNIIINRESRECAYLRFVREFLTGKYNVSGSINRINQYWRKFDGPARDDFKGLAETCEHRVKFMR
ncbi:MULTISPECIES: hypothetical protein [unclassified Caballeronia]|uniref:hypothetical protein n=1 Tax=unclassified Caballeronia TaxID=2646786 RepID=UPI002028C294|nr:MULTISPECIES: hypothetical protein [unclassified Caballeronia]